MDKTTQRQEELLGWMQSWVGNQFTAAMLEDVMFALTASEDVREEFNAVLQMRVDALRKEMVAE